MPEDAYEAGTVGAECAKDLVTRAGDGAFDEGDGSDFTSIVTQSDTGSTSRLYPYGLWKKSSSA